MPVIRVMVDGVNVTANVERIPSTFTPADSDLGEHIATAEFTFDNDGQSKVPALGMEVLIYNDAQSPALQFGGRISEIAHITERPWRTWRATCQDHNVRAFETATGSLTFTGSATDREMVIAIFRDAMDNTASSPSGVLLDDPIITANEAVSWSGVQATAFLSGMDFSYMSPANAMDILTKYVPDVHWRIGPDKILSYGNLTTLAPFALTTSPNETTTKAYWDYSEEIFIGDHRNKMRRGGFETAEATAYDEVSIAKLGRVLEAPYVNDEAVPAADIRRRTYAELASRDIRRRIGLTVSDYGLKAGQLLDVVYPAMGSGTIPAPFPDTLRQAATRSDYGVLAGERGRFLVQRVTTRVIGPDTAAYEIEAGDYVRDLSKGLAKLVSNG